MDDNVLLASDLSLGLQLLSADAEHLIGADALVLASAGDGVLVAGEGSELAAMMTALVVGGIEDVY